MGDPDELIQSDLTGFNDLPILTIEDDHSRKGWAQRIEDATDDVVVEGMKELHPNIYENLLTDNGSQFCRMNSTMRRYCERHITGRHIWSSVHHPRTLGKLSAFQKGLKAFLIHRLGNSTDKNEAIRMNKTPDEIINSYINWNFGNLIGVTDAVFDKDRKEWVAHLQSDYPRVIVDDKEQRRFLRFLPLRDLGEIRLTEDLKEISGTQRSECTKQVDMLLNRWQQQAERIIVSASAAKFAKIGVAKDTLNPILVILSNLLREGKERITYDEIHSVPRHERMLQYCHFLEQLSLLKATKEGYEYGPLFTELRVNTRNDEEFKTIVITDIIKNHYQTIRGFFSISRFEPIIHVDNCYYRPALEVEGLIGRKEESIIRP